MCVLMLKALVTKSVSVVSSNLIYVFFMLTFVLSGRLRMSLVSHPHRPILYKKDPMRRVLLPQRNLSQRLSALPTSLLNGSFAS